MDDIPIVRLDDDELPPVSAPAATKVGKGKSKKKATTAPRPPPEFDRAGEMPAGAVAPAPVAPVVSSGLAGVDLTQPARPSARYDEYTLDDEPRAPPSAVTSAVASGAVSAVPSGAASPAPAADVPAEQGQAIKVTKVKKKKKKVVAAA